MADRICVARIGAAHGVRGEVKLWSFTEEPAAIANYGPLETLDGKQRFEIEALRSAKDHFVARIAGVTGREAAEKLRNLELYIPRAPPAIEETILYHADLVGPDVVTPTECKLALCTRCLISAPATSSTSYPLAAVII